MQILTGLKIFKTAFPPLILKF